MSASRFSFLYSFRVSKRDILHRILLLVLRTYVKWANNNNVREWPRTNVPEYSNTSDSTMLTPSLICFFSRANTSPSFFFRILFKIILVDLLIYQHQHPRKEQASVSSPPYCILVRNKEQIKKRERENSAVLKFVPRGIFVLTLVRSINKFVGQSQGSFPLKLFLKTPL